MLYSFNEDDLKLHKRFHNNRLRGFVLRVRQLTFFFLKINLKLFIKNFDSHC
jgi:hypothetical protein